MQTNRLGSGNFGGSPSRQTDIPSVSKTNKQLIERIELKLKESSETTLKSHRPIATVGELLDAIAKERPGQYLGTLKTAANLFSDYIGIPVSQLKISFLKSAGSGFSTYLFRMRNRRGEPLKIVSVRCYCSGIEALLRSAQRLGWSYTPSAVESEWNSVVAGLKMTRGISGLIRFALARGKAPSQLTDNDVQAFQKYKLGKGRSPLYANNIGSTFKRIIAAANLQDKFPLLTPPKDYRYAIPLEKMPEPLQSELRELLAFKLGKSIHRVEKKGKVRPISAREIEAAVTRLFGYAVSELKMDPETPRAFLDLVCPGIVEKFITWQLETREVESVSLLCLGLLRSALCAFPPYSSIDFSWFTNLLDTIPKYDEEELAARKDRKLLSYDELSQIPGKIAQEKEQAESGSVEYARLAHDELLILWMLAFAWRPTNIRECSLGTDKREPNLFKSTFGNRQVAKPGWVEKKLKQNPSTKFWQIHFTSGQVKGKRHIRGVVPRHLVPFLEAYLLNHRHLLVGEIDDGTLFLNRYGRQMKRDSIVDLVGTLTFKYGGRRVTPHLFRDAFATCWLEENPEDYLTVSKILWHRHIQTTLEHYAGHIDESYGTKKAGEWIERRKKHR